MSKRGNRYTPEFRYQIVELVRSGRGVIELSKEFGVSIWSIRNWVKQAARDAGTGDQGLTSAEREELSRLRRENRKLKKEREILSNVWSARLIDNLAAYEVYLIEFGTKVLVFRVEESMKDVIFKMGGCPRTLALLRLHFNRPLVDDQFVQPMVRG
jgi:transposase